MDDARMFESYQSGGAGTPKFNWRSSRSGDELAFTDPDVATADHGYTHDTG
jgi:hypothetical protein